MHHRQKLAGWYAMAVVASVLAAGGVYEGDAVGRHGRERVSGEPGGADRGSWLSSPDVHAAKAVRLLVDV